MPRKKTRIARVKAIAVANAAAAGSRDFKSDTIEGCVAEVSAALTQCTMAAAKYSTAAATYVAACANKGLSFSRHQLVILEAVYSRNQSPDESLLSITAHLLQTTIKQTAAWFERRRSTNVAAAAVPPITLPPPVPSLVLESISPILLSRLQCWRDGLSTMTEQQKAAVNEPSTLPLFETFAWNEITTKRRSPIVLPALANVFLYLWRDGAADDRARCWEPVRARIWYLIALSIFVQMKTHLVLAMESASFAIQLEPKMLVARRLRSWISDAMGNFASSLRDMQVVVQETPMQEDAALRCSDIIMMGKLMIKSNELDLAFSTLQAAKLLAGLIASGHWVRAVAHGESFSCSECDCDELVGALPFPNCMNCQHPIESHPMRKKESVCIVPAISPVAHPLPK